MSMLLPSFDVANHSLKHCQGQPCCHARCMIHMLSHAEVSTDTLDGPGRKVLQSVSSLGWILIVSLHKKALSADHSELTRSLFLVKEACNYLAHSLPSLAHLCALAPCRLLALCLPVLRQLRVPCRALGPCRRRGGLRFVPKTRHSRSRL